MANTKILIPGEELPVAAHQSIKAYFSGVEIQSYKISAVRGAEASAVKVDVESSDVVVTAFEDNIQWFNNGSDFIDKIQTQQPPMRGASADGTLYVPQQWQENNAQSRGIVTSGLKLLGLHIFKNVAGRAIAKDIAKYIEKNNPNTVYACDESFNLSMQFKASDARPASKYLLLLHGTGSNTKSAFAGLMNQPGNSIYSTLFKAYEQRIIAYEHKTFSQSPVQNIIELVAQLPDNITLDILSHSRGGLLGEVLARISSRGTSGAFTQEEINMLKKNDDAATLVTEIETLNKAVAKKQLKVNTFVRVACPAAGTTLVSDRADKLLNVLFNVLSNIPGEVASTIVEGIQALVTAVVNEKNNTATLPGIECMKPDSNFIKVLNYYNTKIDSKLVVIAGDALGEGFVNKMKMFLVDSFYKEDNDLVVNTISMKKGTPRTSPFLIYDEQAANVNHFNYFVNSPSQNKIITAFTGTADTTKGFYENTRLIAPVPPDVSGTPQNRAGKSIKEQQVLYVLPGIMGSNLEADNIAVWLNYFRIASGDLKLLEIESTASVKAKDLNGSAYKKLVDHFSNYYYVIPFAYDWRRSVFSSAKELSDSIKQSLADTEETKQTIAFIVHSMGGLVFRAFVTEYPELWQQLLQRPGCRVLMLGTPNAGSYIVPRILLGNDKTINALAALDLTSNKKSLLQQFIKYEGLLELLPAKGIDDFSDMGTWKNIQQASGLEYVMPGAASLTGYIKMQENKFRNFQYDASIVKYIAGKSDQTPSGIKIDAANEKVDFYATPRGDGKVTWDSIPSELTATATYYVNAEHGSLANHEMSFKGYHELLVKGATTLLNTNQPVTRSSISTELMPRQDQVPVPDEATLSNNIMGIDAPRTAASMQQVNISITHGDLAHADHPLIVGHFNGDGIFQAEKVLDKKLDNYLSILNATNNYPGPIGTHEIIPGKKKFKGAIIVGLGDFGELTENLLARTLRQALLSYIIEKKKNACNPEKTNTSGVSYLLIGSGFGGLTLYSSIKAILTAVKEVNSFFETGRYPDYSLITAVEIIELYQYKAVQAGRILRMLTSSNSLFGNISFLPDTIRMASGAISEIPDETQSDWWHRLKISCKDEPVNGSKTFSREIVFTSITDKARNEEKVLNTNISLVDQLIKKAAAVTNHDIKLCQTLYELLIPNEFKGYGSDLRNIVLLVDKETARYPWEMMMDAYSGYKEPLVTKTGFLRQLGTSTYRQKVEISVENNALVIGNPELHNYNSYPSLLGAGQEAEAVADLLKGFGYNVTAYIDEESQNALLELYSKQYKIVHIAAHGVLNDKVTGQTGIVLGEQLILTPSDFKQMRKVPELVFINCCSLGTINKADEEHLQRKYEVAAGIGTQLIEMGVKTVIVAGWEVNDDAAAGFSYSFYTEMLKGRNYGDAVQTARATIYNQYSESNTWGAYQCYGDPQYYLRAIGSTSDDNTLNFCDPIEAVDKLQTLISQLEAASTRDEKDARTKEIDRVIKAIEARPEWGYNAYITELKAELYKQSGNATEAIRNYELLFSIENAEYTVKTVEQYCNVKAKQAAKECKAVLNSKAAIDIKNAARKKAETTINEMIKILENISIRNTSERLSIIASAYRRFAEINVDNTKIFRENLIRSAGYYFQGYDLFRKTYDKSDYYPLHNWLIIASIVDKLATKAEQAKYAEILQMPADLDNVLNNAEAYAGELDKMKPGFWHKTSASAKFLLNLVLAKSIDEINKFKQAIIDNHIESWEKEGSADKQNAISDHANFVESMFKKYGDQLETNGMLLINEKLKALQDLQKELQNLANN
jgi:CHAT domain-containing protein